MKQTRLFERRCHGCSSCVCREHGDVCLQCGAKISYRMGYMNCGVTEARWWELLTQQVAPNAGTVGEYDVPDDGILVN